MIMKLIAPNTRRTENVRTFQFGCYSPVGKRVETVDVKTWQPTALLWKKKENASTRIMLTGC